VVRGNRGKLEWGFSAKTTMEELFLHNLQDIHHAERQATNRNLSQGLKNHLEETKRQIGAPRQGF
jgi:ferritin-like metal-binding protein YciE